MSVVIPVIPGTTTLGRCLQAIGAARPAPMEVIVAIDGADASLEAEARAVGARVLRGGGEEGPGARRNAGAREARGDVLLFVDADVQIAPGTIGRVAAVLAAEPELAAVFGSYDDGAELPGFWSQYKGLLNHWVHQNGNAESSSFWSACGAVRRRVFFEAGGFDPGQRWLEDIELGYRLTGTGRRVRLLKELQVTHLKRWGALSLLRSDLCHRALPWSELVVRYGRMPDDLNLDWGARISVACAGALLSCLTAALWWPVAAAVAIVPASGLLVANAGLYRFFAGRRGPWFAAIAIGCHWLYLLLGAAGFATGAAAAILRRRRGAAALPIS